MALKHARTPDAATLHAHFHILSGRTEDADPAAPITPAETREAVERFIRWHKRQVAVGERMLADLPPEETENHG